MPSPYPLSYGCIFREEFLNPYLAAQNGLVVTGNPWLGGGAKGVAVTAGNTILVPKLVGIKTNIITILIDAEFYPAGSGPALYSEAFRVHTPAGEKLIFGRQRSDGTLYVSSGVAAVFSSTISRGRKLVGVSLDGTNATFFSNGNSMGTSVFNTTRIGGSYVMIGSPVPISAQYYWTLPIYSISIYNYAMTPSEILQNYQITRGLTA